MKTVVHIVDTLCVGGRENSVIDICNQLDKIKYNVFVITLTNDLNDLAYKVNSDVTLFALPFKHKELIGFNTMFSFMKIVSGLANLLNTISPDIIHTHSYLHRLLIVNLAIRRVKNKIKCFHTIHTSGMYYNSKRHFDRFKFFVDKTTIKLTEPYLVGISEIVQKNNVKFFKNQSKDSRYIPNGVDLGIYNKTNYKVNPSDFGLSKDDIIITYVARLSMGKNHMTLLNAARIVVEKYPLVKFLFAGDGENRNEIEEFILQNNLNENVLLLGSINNVPELLSISSFCVFPSEFEGFSLTLVEKMATGLTVIAADNDIFKSLIIHRENGLLFSMFDERDLANNIFELIENKELCEKISSNSRSFSEQFSIKEMILKYESYYEI